MGWSIMRSRSRSAIRQAVDEHPLISKYFRILGADKMVPAEFRQTGFTDYLDAEHELGRALKSLRTTSSASIRPA